MNKLGTFSKTIHSVFWAAGSYRYNQLNSFFFSSSDIRESRVVIEYVHQSAESIACSLYAEQARGRVITYCK